MGANGSSNMASVGHQKPPELIRSNNLKKYCAMEEMTKYKNNLLTNLKEIIADDKRASEFQNLGQYRKMLIDMLNLNITPSEGNPANSKNANCAIFDVSNWVAVKDQLPPDVTEKYMVLRNGEIEFDKWIFDGNKGYWWDYIGITHWMQIPEPPCC